MILVADIQRTVAEHFGLPVSTMREQNRVRDLSRPRQVAMYLSRRLTPLSTVVIGQRFNRDHSTIVNGSQVVQRLCADDVSFSGEVAWLEAKISVDAKTKVIPPVFRVLAPLYQQVIPNSKPCVPIADLALEEA